MALVLPKKDLGEYLESLSKTFEIWAPVKKGNIITFDIWKPSDEVVLDYDLTNSPIKRAFFPPNEVIIKYTNSLGEVPDYDKRILVFGLKSYDAAALKILDRSFKEKVVDTYYWRRRKNALIVAVSGKDAVEGFSSKLKLDLKGAYDIYLSEDKSNYVLNVATNAGNELVKNKYVQGKAAKEESLEHTTEEKLDLKAIEAFLDTGPGHDLWEKLSRECFACGVCSYVCPICHCFDLEDTLDLRGKQGERKRCWDSCMLADFSSVAGGVNFREKRSERIHNWFHHKFSRAVKERGIPDCVGCGRCIRYCPAKIDIMQVLKRCEAQG